MICPDCQYENLPGADVCAECGQPLSTLDAPVSELEESIISLPISAVGGRRPVAVAAAQSVRSVIDRMNAAKTGTVLVEQDGACVGIFTERDVLNRVSGRLETLDGPVSAVMTPTPETIQADDTIAYALHTMSINGYRHLPVADGSGRPSSLISARNILHLLVERFT